MGALLLVTWAAASAQFPVFVDDISSPEQAQFIDDLERATTFHGRLATGEVDYYRVDAEGGDVASFQILVPQRDELRDFRPNVTVSGPGLPAGGEPVLTSAAGVDLYDPTTHIYYWSFGATGDRSSSATLPQEGTYEIAVGVDRGDGGPYAITTGTEESWGPLDIVTFPLDWARVRLWYFS